MSADDLRTLAAQVSNWGRWGADDQAGTTNLITDAHRVAAARLVRRGAVFQLGLPLDQDGPPAFPGRINPLHVMTETGAGQHLPGDAHWSDDYIVMPLQAATQWDALAHVWYDGRLYNGFPDSMIGPHGAARCAIPTLANGVTGRGVLLDVAGHLGVPWLDGGFVIGPELVDEVAAAQRVEVGAGDVVLVRTGWLAKFRSDGDAAGWMNAEPGLGRRCVPWLRQRDVAAVASDNWGVEVAPGERPTVESSPVHCLLLRDVGMPLGELFDLEALAADCHAYRTWEFLFTAPPLKVTGAVGTPLNPLAIK